MAGPWVFYMQLSFLHISTLSCTCCDAEARSLISLLFSSRPLSPWFELEQISGLLSGKCSWRLFPRAATSVAACAQVGRRVHWRDSGKAAQGLGLECFRVVLIFGTWFRCDLDVQHIAIHRKIVFMFVMFGTHNMPWKNARVRASLAFQAIGSWYLLATAWARPWPF